MRSSKVWFQTTKTCLLDGSSGSIHLGTMDEPVWKATQPGIASGAVLVERLRTFGGKVPDLSYHRTRLALGAECFGWSVEAVLDAFELLIPRLYRENQLEQVIAPSTMIPDVGIVFLLMPSQGDEWLAFAHLVELPWERLHQGYSEGVDLSLIPGSFPPLGSLPTGVKHRSRVGYWLADRQANRSIPGSSALLMTPEQHVADTSFANLVVVNSENAWVSPNSNDCHLGVTIRRTVAMLRAQPASSTGGAASTDPRPNIHFRSIAKAELQSAQEIFLVGSTGIAYPVRRIADPQLDALIYRQLPSELPSQSGWQTVQKLWREAYGLDVVAQAQSVISGC